MPKIKLINDSGTYSWSGYQFLGGNVYDVPDRVAHYLCVVKKVAIEASADGTFAIPSAIIEEALAKEKKSVKPMMRNNPLKIALIRIGGVGDSIILAKMARAVKRKYPGCHTTIFVRDKNGYEITTNNPAVDHVVMSKNAEWETLLQKVLLQDFDIVYDNRYVTKVCYKHPSLWEKEKAITDKLFEPYAKYYNEFPHLNNQLSHYIAFNERKLGLETADLVGDDDDLHIELKVEDFILRKLLNEEKYVTIHNGSDMARQTKCWETEKWDKVAKHLLDQKYKVIQLGAKFESVVDGVINLTGQTSLTQAAALISGADFHIDTESGLVHMARAVRTRSIVLFGPTPMNFFGYDENTNIVGPFECQGKWWTKGTWWRECPEKYPHPPKCMESITVDAVVDAIEHMKKMEPLEEILYYDPCDINEQFAMELTLGEAHYKAEPWQWDRVHAMMSHVKGKEVLEVGAGDGYCVEFLTEQGYDVTGIEISKIRLKRMEEKGIKCQYGDIHNLPFPDNSFDTVICGEVLEHIPSMAAGLAELERVCRPNGIIVISLPIGDLHRHTKMHLWGIGHQAVLRNGKEDMVVMTLERINGNEKGASK